MKFNWIHKGMNKVAAIDKGSDALQEIKKMAV